MCITLLSSLISFSCMYTLFGLSLSEPLFNESIDNICLLLYVFVLTLISRFINSLLKHNKSTKHYFPYTCQNKANITYHQQHQINSCTSGIKAASVATTDKHFCQPFLCGTLLVLVMSGLLYAVQLFVFFALV